ncbi:se38 [Alphabaculovirus alterspexiguae]|uniref:Se38 n=1 Tax=Spodoptera exigua multiple nucleopolyhedrovirus TaxID=10454 RepID=A0A3G2JTX6_9ABAC|nr:se38 [Spodoptera exigua multiple nucleopolyhedrovirus]AYN44998.1 se38 [Spodoptera exigua multiple nucleopolyhedrovirus]
MKLVTFVMAINNNNCVLDQQQIYETYLKYFDVIDAIMCINGDCLAVCVSTVDSLNRPTALSKFKCNNLQIVDQHHDVEMLLDRMYNIVELYNNQ